MQEIGQTKSLFYGAIIMLIFMFSSCDFGVLNQNADATAPATSPAQMHAMNHH